MSDTTNPLATAASLKRPFEDAPVPQPILEAVDAVVSVAETVASNVTNGTHNGVAEFTEPSAKRPKLDGETSTPSAKPETREKGRGVAMIKEE